MRTKYPVVTGKTHESGIFEKPRLIYLNLLPPEMAFIVGRLGFFG